MTDRNIVDLAQAVQDAVVPDVPWKIQLQEFQARAAAAPTLARAVIDLTDKLATRDAQAERVEAQAQAWEAAASMIEAHGGDTETIRDMLQDLRTALNGETA